MNRTFFKNRKMKVFTNFFIFWLLTNPDSALAGTDDMESLLASISLFLYTGQTTDEYKEVMIGHEFELMDEVNISQPTVLYIHGWMENPNMASVQTVVAAYLKRQDHNVMAVNWSKIAMKNYLSVFSTVAKVGSTIAEGLNNLVKVGLEPSTIHIVGHSLGSHIAGFIGRNLTFRLPRITGLDPAGPGFHFLVDSLTSADAEFVDVIHTDAGIYGTTKNRGNVSFFPNGGNRVQPGCPVIRLPLSLEGMIIHRMRDFCDHQRSWAYYAESVLNEDAFIGVECDSHMTFKLGLCKSNSRVVMGYGTPTTVSGKVYLETNSESPYGRGTNGE